MFSKIVLISDVKFIIDELKIQYENPTVLYCYGPKIYQLFLENVNYENFVK